MKLSVLGTPKVTIRLLQSSARSVPERHQGLRQSAHIVLRERPPVDENHPGLDLSGQRRIRADRESSVGRR